MVTNLVGELVALLGPSGCGKTTLLNLLSRRQSRSLNYNGTVLVNGTTLEDSDFRSLTSFVEQEDALIGSLTVRETIDFAGRLSPSSHNKDHQRLHRVDRLLQAFGLTDQADTLIGTPVRKGISGGQKRRTSLASALITNPSILFLDEPTSGLDSAASYEVISYLRTYARRSNTLVIASIHQPSTKTFQCFDRLLLLSQGQTCYFGPVRDVYGYFGSIGYQIPQNTNPAEFLLDLVNVDFATDNEDRTELQQKLETLHASWARHVSEPKANSPQSDPPASPPALLGKQPAPRAFSTILILLHRMFLKSYRDVIAYGVRLAMYTCLAILMGTVWLRLSSTQESIQPFINAIFFGGAFLSFMAVAYVPAYLEDRATFVKDRANGLYGAASFSIANFIIGMPYLFIFTAIFSVIAYWLTGFRADGVAFMRWIMWIYLDLLAAESLVVLVTSLLPNFVLSLAIVAFANGLWMCVGGFLVSPTILNVFWRYVFHYIDYQAYVFQGMMVNEFEHRTYDCGSDCRCIYDSSLAGQCKIDGKAVLQTYGYATGRTGKWVGILLAIILVYRLMGYLALKLSRT